MNEKCFIIGHLTLGDLFIINGLVRYFSTKYIKTYILCKKINFKSICQIFSDNKSIIPIYIDTNDYNIQINHFIFEYYNNCDIIKLGTFNNNWYVLKSDFLINNIPYLFFKTFYEQASLEYTIRYKYEKINRNITNEYIFYKNIMNNYNNKYIFIHNKDNSKICNDIYNENIPIFHPNFNYYDNVDISYNNLCNGIISYNNLWNGIISDNILDYSYIIENAYELHLIFSSFLALSMFLDLSKVKKKYIYTTISNIKDYHTKLEDWIIIYK